MLDADVPGILERHGISIESVEPVESTGGERIYDVNGDYVLRISESGHERLIRNLTRVEGLVQVPTLLIHGRTAANPSFDYLLCRKIHGVDLVRAIPAMSNRQRVDLGRSIAAFLRRLHAIRRSSYDIGHYVPIVPDFSGAWKEGHERYWRHIARALDETEGGRSDRALFGEAFDFLEANGDALVQQRGSVLLHNDLHPKNVIVKDGSFAGVIDWECAQFGEPDFEYVHFFHWCLFPPDGDVDFGPVLGSLLEASGIRTDVRDFATRQTIYQIEHELMQIVWSRGKARAERVPRIRRWLDGGLDTLLETLTT